MMLWWLDRKKTHKKLLMPLPLARQATSPQFCLPVPSKQTTFMSCQWEAERIKEYHFYSAKKNWRARSSPWSYGTWTLNVFPSCMSFWKPHTGESCSGGHNVTILLAKWCFSFWEALNTNVSTLSCRAQKRWSMLLPKVSWFKLIPFTSWITTDNPSHFLKFHFLVWISALHSSSMSMKK